jgi:hypothetical protein
VAKFRVSTNTDNKTTRDKTNKTKTKVTIKTKMDQLWLFTFRHELFEISVHLQTEFAAETSLAEGQWLKEQLNVVWPRMFRVGTRIPTFREPKENIQSH